MNNLTEKLAVQLKTLRLEHNWSLDQLAEQSGVSRATLSRLEKADVSPTTEVLARLCTAYSISLSRLLAKVEDAFTPVIRKNEQETWKDNKAGFERRILSPPSNSLTAEVIECRLKPDTTIAYDAPSVRGQEHHLLMREGQLVLTIEDKKITINAGDTIRYCLHGKSEFQTGKQSAHYLIVLV